MSVIRNAISNCTWGRVAEIPWLKLKTKVKHINPNPLGCVQNLEDLGLLGLRTGGRQLNLSHPSTHGIPNASERPSRSSSTTLFHSHRTSVSTSAIFGDRYYTLKDLLISKVHNPPPDWGISYILSQPPSLPLCLLTTDSVQWAHTPLLLPPPPPPTPTKDPSPTICPPAHFNALILQQST